MKAIVTCSGVSNTGKLTTQAAVALLRHDTDTLEWIRAGAEPGRLLQTVKDADQVIVINGCADCCAKKKLQALGVGQSSCCRAVEHEGTVYEEIPAPLIRSAILKVLGKEDEAA